jgi:hypothetical protein
MEQLQKDLVAKISTLLSKDPLNVAELGILNALLGTVTHYLLSKKE